MDRNQFFMVGILCICLGAEVRAVDTFTVTPAAAKLMAGKNVQASLFAESPVPKIIKPPRWLGWSFIAGGMISVLHAYGMKKPGA